MKQLKKEMKAVLKDLKQLTKRSERIAVKLDKLEKASRVKPKAKAKKAPAKKTVKKKVTAKKRPAAKKKAPTKKAAAKRGKKMSASDTILKIIQSRKTPIDTATLKKRTGFKDNNIRMIVYRLKKRGEIKSVRKGVYQKA